MNYYFRPKYSSETFFVELNMFYWQYTNHSNLLYMIEGKHSKFDKL